MFTAALFTIAKIWKQPINRQVDRKAVAHLHDGILLGHKKEQNLTIFNSMDELKGIMLSEISQTEKDHMISFICGIKAQNK